MIITIDLLYDGSINEKLKTYRKIILNIFSLSGYYAINKSLIKKILKLV